MNDQPTHPSKDVKQPPSHLTSQNEMVSTDPQAQGGGELREIVARIWYSGYDRKLIDSRDPRIDDGKEGYLVDEYEKELEQLITTRLRALVTGMEAERPENLTGPIKLGTYLESKIDQIESDAAMVIAYRKGFNTANAQWGTLLAKKRDTL